MDEIILASGRQVLPSAEELHTLFEYNAITGDVFRKVSGRGPNTKKGARVGTLDGKGYLHCRIDGQPYKLHRIIWVIVHGHIPTDMIIDHKNGRKDDNRLENLRLATLSQNGHNATKKMNSDGKYKGVSYHSGKRQWSAEIRVDNVRYYLGTFLTEIEAANAYSEASIEAFGDFHKEG